MSTYLRALIFSTSLDGTGGKLDARVNGAVRVAGKPRYGGGPLDSGSRNLAVRAGAYICIHKVIRRT